MRGRSAWLRIPPKICRIIKSPHVFDQFELLRDHVWSFFHLGPSRRSCLLQLGAKRSALSPHPATLIYCRWNSVFKLKALLWCSSTTLRLGRSCRKYEAKRTVFHWVEVWSGTRGLDSYVSSTVFVFLGLNNAGQHRLYVGLDLSWSAGFAASNDVMELHAIRASTLRNLSEYLSSRNIMCSYW